MHRKIAYILTLFLLWSLSWGLKAQIAYVDVPDQTLTVGQSATFDLTSDGDNEINISVNLSGSTFITFTRPALNAGVSQTATLQLSGPNIQKLAAGASIGPSSGTYTAGSTFFCSACIQALYPWAAPPVSDVYVGFRFVRNSGTTHYGWVRVDVPTTANTVTIKDFGWEQSPNTAIIAGATGQVLVNQIVVYGQGGQNTISTPSGSLQMFAATTPTNATDTSKTWTTNNNAIATINSSTGLLQAVTNGTVRVFATANDGSGVSGFKDIVISGQFKPVSSIQIGGQGGASAVVSTQTLQMTTYVLPTDATDTTVSWGVINGTGTATINASGVLTGGNPGTVQVTATANDGSGNSATANITVDPLMVSSISVQGQGGATSVQAAASLQMVATVSPTNASNTGVSWSVNNQTGSATINPSTGLLSAGSPGTVEVCATANDGSGVVGCTVITVDPILVSSITVQGQSGQTNVQASASLQMLATVSPANASNPSVSWSVVNGTGTATINSSGLLTGGNPGTVQVCATANDGSGVSDCVTITIDPILVSSISVQGQAGATSVQASASLQMLATVSPATASNPSVSWTVTNGTGTATINSSGVLSGGNPGTVQVCATANDGSGVSDCVTITIDPILVSSISVQGQAGATVVQSSSSLQMLATVSPANATNNTVSWSVVNGTGTATINSSGVLTGGNPGTVQVCAMANDGSGVSDCVTITVDPILVSSIIVQGQGGVGTVQSSSTLQMLATVSPANATNNTVSWSVVNGTGSATINSSGVLTGGSPGTVQVCATANDGSGVSDCVTITINPILVSSITVQGQGGATAVQSSATLQMLATVSPATASNPSVSWTVTNGTGSATINGSGVLTAGSPGTVQVCATANDGSGVSDCVTITIDPILVSSITVQGQGGATAVQSSASLQMLATVSPANASNPSVSWTVTNGTGTATINSSGVLTGGNPGTVQVCATANDGSGVSDCVTITIDPILVSSISVQGQGGATSVQASASLQMLATVSPANASNPSVSWTVTNGTGTATINSSGVLTGGNPGTVQVCATANDGSGVSDCVTITIDPILVSSISVQGQGGATAVQASATLQMLATVSPANATNNTVSWSVVNGTGSATINSSGVLTGGNPGTVQVCATANDGSGVSDCVTITIDPILVSSISVQGQGGATSVQSSSTLQMLATVSPANASNPSVSWTVTNGTGTATINSSGVLTAGNPGTVQVCATANDGSGVSDCVTITIDPILVSSITVQGQGGATTVQSSSTLQMLATVSPANASDPSVSWTVTNGTGTATINSSGVLTAGNPGTVQVCATANDGSGVSDCVTITIDPILVSSITVQGQGGATIVQSSSTLQMLATVSPTNASNPSVTWTVTNGTGTATINSSGVLTGGNPGTVQVCATANDGSGASDCVMITIDPILVSSISVQGQGGATTIQAGANLQMVATVSPTNASNQTVVWSVNNQTGTATIDSNTGLLSATTAGTVEVCATATDGSGVSGCTVINITTTTIFVSSISVQGQGGATNVQAGSSLQMEATVSPANASNQTVVWSVTNQTGTATIDPNTGLLSATTAGTVEVCATATDGSGVSGCTTITILTAVVAVSSITVQGQAGQANVTLGNTLQMLATVNPANATNTTVSWSVNNQTGTASIDPITGLLTTNTEGTVEICATATDGSGVSGCTIITIDPILVSSITVQGQGGATTVQSSTSLQMLATVSPANASNPSVSWAVNNQTGTATINSSTGVLTAGNPGTVEVCATANDGSGVSDCITITIDPILVSSITVQGQGGVTNVQANASLQMLATISPANASNPSVSWSVTNGTGTATINSSGVLTAGNPGTVQVCATANDGSGVSDCITITIDPILVSSITVQGQGGLTNVQANASLQMLTMISPANASNPSVSWSVTNGTGTATINSSGVLTAGNPGTVQVCATANDGSGVSDCITITIDPILVSGITVQGQGGATTVQSSTTLQMLATVSPVNASNNSVTWSVNNQTGTATINSSTGVLTAGNPGTVEVCAVANDGSGVSDCIIITIDPILVFGITVQGQGGATAVLSSSTLQMQAIISPANASNPNVTWTVSNQTGTATISSSGVLTGGNPGTVEVCATATDGSGVSDCTTITVTTNIVLVSSITVQGQGGATTVQSSSTLQMLATVAPANASNNSVTWSVNNQTGTATINSSTGVLTAGNPGTVEVCATANDGSGVSDCIIITIDPILVSSITVQGQGGATTVQSSSSLQMLATVAPANASNNSVTWSVNNQTGTATVNSSTGVLTAGNPGTVEVCATATDGSGISDCIIITIDPILVSSITVQGQGGATTVASSSTLQMLATVSPANASNPTVTWSVNNQTGSATISASGVLSPTSAGTVEVCATATDGSGVSDCIIITISNVFIPVTAISVQGQGGTASINSGASLQMQATVTPANATNPTVTWSVNNQTGSATINANTGQLMAGSPGTVEVCATANDGSGVVGCTIITINAVLVSAISVQGQGGATTVPANASLQMLATITPANATDNSVTWSVNNQTGSATINPSTGVLTAGSPGTVEVCATANDGSGISDCIIITVDPILVSTISVQGQGGATTVPANASLQMLATVTPTNASNPSVSWTVNNQTGSATINPSTGMLMAGNPGTVEVCATATDGSGVSDCIVITVDPIYVSGISVQGQGGQSSITTLNGNLQMIATVTPTNASNPTVVWSVNDPTIATIDPNTGLLTAVSNGLVTVTATATDGSNVFGSTVIVINNQSVMVQSILVNSQSGIDHITSNAGSLQMIATVLPTSANNQNVNWSVSNSSIASINATGVLQALTNGVVTVTATATDGSGVSGSKQITISNQGGQGQILVSSIQVLSAGGNTEINLPNGTLQLFAVVSPANADNPNVSWSVSNTSVGTIDQSGVLTARGNGQVLVVATAQDMSGVSGSILIDVSNQPTATNPIALTEGQYRIYPNPLQEILNLELELPMAVPEARLQIFDFAGRLLLDRGLNLPEGFSNTQVQLPADWPSGLYFLQLQTPKGQLLGQKLQKP
ncbi:Ig-like domain-containing protein [Saprospira sp. CCB-QB6]|uniref:Ig-like domain-containing protein n=1 Tax=Saprospira sp. CCB-QB6 TaxID=3023936 RepID=UPI00234B795D|nr:Ig-like domain-containing protein [Saprospira sp. CCB-QB6]WCL82026.1 Ig-like domain-containing protein [Saprospira sp. CCB-QB6]